MKIISIKWRNFASYGNKWTEIKFDQNNSFNLLVGQNGTGKSSVSEIIQYGLFGKVATKTLKDIPNRSNRSLEVEIELIANQRYIKIHRGLEPNKFSVQVDKDKNYGDRASKLEVQKTLEEEFYGIPYVIFNNIISLSINDFKSFIKMTPADKRNIIDKIFGLSILNKMSEILKLEYRKIKERDRDLTNKIQILTEQIDITTDKLDQLSDQIIQNGIERKDKIQEELQQLMELKEKFTNDFKKLLDYEHNKNKEIQSNERETQQNNILIRELDKKIKLYENDKCPTCNSDLHTNFHKDLLKGFVYEKTKLNKFNYKLKEERKKLYLKINALQQKKEKFRKRLYNIETKNSNFEFELKEIENLNKVDDQTMSMRTLIEETNIKLDTILDKKKKTENTRKFYGIIENILSDKGVKQQAIKKIVPSINVQVLKLMKELNMEFQLQFTDDFNAKITQLGREINPSTLSTGENKKLDFIIIIAIIKLMKMKFPGLNLLFLDEIFSSLDSDSVHHVLLILNRISKEHNLHIFVVNHAPLDNNVFDYKYETKKKNGFSYLIQEKLL